MVERNGSLLDSLARWLGMNAAPAAAESDVTWMLLPPYDIPGMAVISGLLVENQGLEDAEDVYISLIYEDERVITHMDVVSDDAYDQQGGGPRDSYVTLQIARLRSGSKVVVYVAGHSEQSPQVTVAVQMPPTAGR